MKKVINKKICFDFLYKFCRKFYEKVINKKVCFDFLYKFCLKFMKKVINKKYVLISSTNFV